MGLIRTLSVESSGALEKAARLFSRITNKQVPIGHRQTSGVASTWLYEAVRHKDKPWGLSYEILRTLSNRNSVIAAIIHTRVHQISSFSRPASVTHDGRGFAVRHRDVKHVVTKAERKLIAEHERFIAYCGNTDTPRPRFNHMLKAAVLDSLRFDQLCIERVFNRKGALAELHGVDAGSIRLQYDPATEDLLGYFQIVEGRDYTHLAPEQLIFAVDNPRTDMEVGGYGYSAIERIISVVTSHLFAEDVNKRRIQPGTQLDGLLWAEGAELSQEMLEGLRRSWEAQAQGIIGTGHLAALSLPQGTKLNYIPLHKQLNDMEWARWMDYLINVGCANFLIDPAEVNFPNRGGPAQGTPMFETGHEARLIYSKDKGLRGLLRFLEETLTEGVIRMLEGGEDFVLEFRGIDARTREQESEVAAKETSTYMTINEYRQGRDMPPLPSGDIIRDPSYMQELQQARMQEQQRQAMEQAALGGAQGAPSGEALPGEAGAGAASGGAQGVPSGEAPPGEAGGGVAPGGGGGEGYIPPDLSALLEEPGG